MSKQLSLARWCLAAAAIASAFVAATATAQTAAQAAMQVTLLGTGGGPGGHADRSGIATLLTVGTRHYLVDAGVGVSRQLARAGVSELKVPTVFLTHLHDDHTAGLPALMSFAWSQSQAPGSGMELVGPPGTRRWFDAAMALMAVNAEIRIAENPRRRPPGSMFMAREVQPGLIYSDDAVRVTAIENTHFHVPATHAAAGMARSYALKFESPGRTVVLTGDTGPSDALAKFAEGADILVSEFVSAADIASVPPFVRAHMLEEHLDAVAVGRLAAAARVKTVVLSHMRQVSAHDVEEVRKHFNGAVVIGTDLAKF
jgi:ribonuclease BN (tRNA processing enzyme)